ncbi:MAG: RluA family pseudouridine synthase [Planctomycetes bacterium]|nr:RluA family pseudouridine synthase [Planctomycetota bacterium]
MPDPSSLTLLVDETLVDQTLAAALRTKIPNLSWKAARALISARRVTIGGEVWLDPARRLRKGDRVELLDRPSKDNPQAASVRIVHVDRHFVVIDKSAGLRSVRHKSERNWSASHRALVPAAEDLLSNLLRSRGKQPGREVVRAVHRLDKPTSGLMVFARTKMGQEKLIEQFRNRTAVRRYLAVVPGNFEPQRIVSRLVRDRGDGIRGSTTQPGRGETAITNCGVIERRGGYTLVSCQLESGKTHQIRIHLAELGFPVCGDPVYRRRSDGADVRDASGAPRLALHSTELAFTHPVDERTVQWTCKLPEVLQAFWGRLKPS